MVFRIILKVFLALISIGAHAVFFVFAFAFCDDCNKFDVSLLFFSVGITVVYILLGLFGRLFFRGIKLWLEVFLILFAPLITYFVLGNLFGALF